MTDLEKLALRRDRGYVMRLVLLLGASAIAAAFVFSGLTGGTVSGCLADAFLDGDTRSAEPADGDTP